ncbi:MAG: hypothetical protein LLF94_09950 [Chlamydiales bacterium]|nr:hypothetical protein [Chlamydiales bacterium]
MKYLLIFLFLMQSTLWGQDKHPAGVTFLIADIKYSKEHGVKICEVQHGILSAFLGDVWMNGGDGTVCPKVAQFLGDFPIPKWAVLWDITFPHLCSAIKNSGKWQTVDILPLLLHDAAFLELAKTPPEDPYSIASYKGMLYARKSPLYDLEELQKELPGILFIDLPTHAYWEDKYKMSQLFKQNPQLTRIKPEWKLYEKKYSATLAAEIVSDIPAETYVIKPRGAFLGNGVILVSKEDLDSTLKLIITDNESVANSPDKSYNYWKKDPFSSFIVEKYYPSDLVQLDEKTYEPTMRVSFIMTCDNHQISIEYVSANWILPFKAIDEEGSLNDRKKAHCRPPYFVKPTPPIVTSVQNELNAALPLLFQEMLNGTF